MRAVWREKKRPARIKRLPRSRNIKTGNSTRRKVMWVNDDRHIGFGPPKRVGNSAHKLKFAVEIPSLAFRAIANGIVGGLDHQSIGVRIEIEEHFPGIIEHEFLRFGLCGAQVVAP